MFKNYFTVAIRNIARHKFHTGINIIGLAIGFACAILVGSYIRWETSFNQQFGNTENLYRIIRSTVTGNNESTYDIRTSGALTDVLRNEYPEVHDVTRLIRRNVYVTTNEKAISQLFCFADDNILDTFPLPFTNGNPQTLSNATSALIISETLANKLFGQADPVGQSIKVEEASLGGDYHIAGVFRNLPNSTIHFDLLTIESSAVRPHDQWTRWRPKGWRVVETFLHLKEDVDVTVFEHKIQNILSQYMGDETAQKNAYHLQPFNRIYLHSLQDYNIPRPRGNDPFEYGNSDRLYTAGFISLFMLFIACINFVNLSTSRATLRAKEIGVRKVVGAQKHSLIVQFLTETTLITLASLLLAFSLSNLLFDAFNTLLQTHVQAEAVIDTLFVALSVGLAITFGLLAGLYPAFILSSFKPVTILKNETASTGSGTLRRALVVFQFAASIIFVSLTTIISDQMTFLHQKDLGFRKEGVIGLPIFDIGRLTSYWGRNGSELKLQHERVKSRFTEHPNVLGASATRFNLSGGGRSAFRFPESLQQSDHQMRYMGIDDHFFGLLDIPILEGRNFPPTFTEHWRESKMEFIVTKSVVKRMGWDSAIGKTLEWPYYKKKGPVVGVVDDIHFGPLHNQTEPAIFVPEVWNLKYIYVRVRLDNLPETITFLKEAWTTFLPDRPFQYTFADEELARWYKSETRQQKLIAAFSLLAVFIASLGLFGLASFSIAKRTKEIGIRKILGADSLGLITLLNKEYIYLITIATCIAYPIGFYVAQQWLNSFAHRIQPGTGAFALAGIVALIISLLTVSIHTAKAIRTNPVETLRDE